MMIHGALTIACNDVCGINQKSTNTSRSGRYDWQYGRLSFPTFHSRVINIRRLTAALN